MPNGTLFGDGVCARIKEELLKEFNLHTIVRLPNGVFAPYTSIPTNILFFDRSGPTREVWYYEQPLPEGRKNYTKTAPIQFEEFAPLVAWWTSESENERAWRVPAAELLAAGCNLDRKNPRAKEDITHLPPAQLAAEHLAERAAHWGDYGEHTEAACEAMRRAPHHKRPHGAQTISRALAHAVNPKGCQTVAGGRSNAETSGIRRDRPRTPEGCKKPDETRMGSTFYSLHYHVVFSTKERRPFVRANWRQHLHEYLGGTVRGLGGVAEEVGGVEDHVHLLLSLKTTDAPAEVVRELKKASSVWAAEKHEPVFSWQEGYSIFTASWTHVPVVRRYIAGQEAHHRKTTFVDELKRLLEKNGVQYDPKYLL